MYKLLLSEKWKLTFGAETPPSPSVSHALPDIAHDSCFVLLFPFALHDFASTEWRATGVYSSSWGLIWDVTGRVHPWEQSVIIVFLISSYDLFSDHSWRWRVDGYVLLLVFLSVSYSAVWGEVELLPFVSRSRPPTIVRGHWGGATQRSAAEEDRPVRPWKGKKPPVGGVFFLISLISI